MSTDFEFSDQPQWVWVYSFDENNIFVGTLHFYVAPNTGLPARCTRVKCSPKTSQAGVWNGEKWQYVDDLRGSTYWDQRGNQFVMMELSAFPEWAVTDAPPVAEAGHVVLHTGDAWQQIEDRTGQTYYTADGRPQVVPDAYFILPPDCTFTAPGTPWDHWDGEQWVTDEEQLHAAQVKAARDELTQHISEATASIAPLQDANDMEIATDDEKSALAEWKKYRVVLSRIDVNTAPNITWPVPPAL
jgi:hypothetical protein